MNTLHVFKININSDNNSIFYWAITINKYLSYPNNVSHICLKSSAVYQHTIGSQCPYQNQESHLKLALLIQKLKSQFCSRLLKNNFYKILVCMTFECLTEVSMNLELYLSILRSYVEGVATLRLYFVFMYIFLVVYWLLGRGYIFIL